MPPISLSIQINSPCQENWENMELTEQGRYCNTCKKQVIDFTGLTDQQIRQYFLHNPIPVCGRMLTSQRDHIYDESTPKIKRNLVPVAASLLTLAVFTADRARPTPLKANIIQAPLHRNTVTPLPTDSIVISGTIKNKQGSPLENAEIIFAQIKTVSDKDGNFQFIIPTVHQKPAVVEFSYPNLTREVRSYHPLMGSTRYDITLFEPLQLPCYEIMGRLQPLIQMPVPFSTLSFQPSNKLDSKTIAFLHDLSNFIKENVTEEFVIKPYYKSNKQRAIKAGNMINSFFVDEEGINQDRIFLIDPQLRKSNSAEVIIEFAPKERN